MPGSSRRPPREDIAFLADNGEMANLIRSKDWADTPLGPVQQWPESLRTTIGLCLGSSFPINIVWGPQHIQIYNDGYRVLCGAGHPGVLGTNYKVSWSSAWSVIGEPFTRALAGETSFLENQRMFLERNGYLEETFFTFSLSPIRDEAGGIAGLFHPVTETTATMLGERRVRAVRDLTVRLSEAKSADDVFGFAADTLSSFSFDLPFVLFYQLYELSDSTPCYRLASHTGLGTDSVLCPLSLELDAESPWPIVDLIGSSGTMWRNGLGDLCWTEVCGPYEESPDAAFVVPIRLAGSELPVAIMIAGASSRLPMNDAYEGFYDLVSAAVGAGFTNARAHDEERRRARALAEIDQAKTAFFSNVSHEFRTPLTLMLGPIADALSEASNLPPSQRQSLEIAHRNALRLLKLVNSLLDFSRIEAGRARVHFVRTDLARLTASLASNFRSACERGGLDLIVDCPPLDAPVFVDRDMWEKIVLNLVSNAFKFTLEGSVTVSLHRNGSAVELKVRDTGVGIPEVEVPRIFERFHRIENQRGRTNEGTGIGLALVDELVKLHGGGISVSSAPGHGTEFRVTMPLGMGHLTTDTLGSRAANAPADINGSTFVEEALRWLPDEGQREPLNPWEGNAVGQVMDRPRILLADDNADMRAYVADILTRGGYEVEAVNDGETALAVARRGPLPDLILSDVMMPGVDGFALLRLLRADPAMDGVLVILLSARAGEEARIEGLAAGADDYLIKPFSARELRARIDGAIRLCATASR